MIQHAARLMKATGGGAIVNVFSVNAVTPMHDQGIDVITKAGLASMTESFANVGDRFGELDIHHKTANQKEG